MVVWEKPVIMPFYEYLCSACGASSEFLQRLSDPPERVCPHCGAEALAKQISAASFRLKGGGWYETDFKSDGKRNLAGEPAANKPDAAPGGNGDAKPASAGGDTAAAAPAAANGQAKPAADSAGKPGTTEKKTPPAKSAPPPASGS